jgi:phosphoglycolate phosphatase
MRTKIRAIVWDLDGTLVDSDKAVLSCFQYALKPYSIDVTAADLERLRSKHPSEVLDEFFTNPSTGKCDKGAVKAAYARLGEHSTNIVNEVLVFDGIAAILKRAEDSRLRMGIWTGRDRESAKEILETNGIENHFEHLVAGNMVERNKPFPDGLLMMSDYLRLRPSEILVVGDHPHDMEGSRAAGAYFAGAAWKAPGSAALFANSGTDLIFETVEQMGNWLG